MMRISDEQSLEKWEQRSQELATEHATRQARIKDNMRRIRKRLSARERKRETQRLIVKGRFHELLLKRLAGDPPDCPAASPQFRAWLDAAFDAFVTRADHRELFDLPPLDAPTASPDDPIPGWKPKRHEGAWATIYEGDTSKLPDELVGHRIIVQPRNGTPWTATITAVVERSLERVVVTNSGKPR